MTHKNIIAEIIVFSLIFIFLIIPPFFNPVITDSLLLFNWNFPYRQAGLFIFCMVLYFLSRNLNAAAGGKKGFFYPSMIALSLMFFTAIIIKVITKSPGNSKDMLPSGGLEWLFCVLTFLFSAVYEEIIYRFYFSDALKRLLVFAKINNERVLFLIVEGAGLLAFAFAHFYLGIAAVINATVAHVVLRFLYKKTNLIWNCVIIHFIYNIISLILL